MSTNKVSLFSRLSSNYYIADIALEYLHTNALIVLSTQSKHFKDKAYNLLLKRETQYQYHQFGKIFILKSSKTLTIVPKEFKYIKDITYLSLSCNFLKTIPNSIFIEQLKYLYLYSNNLTSISDNLGKSINLKELHLNNNRLKTIPRSIGQLKNLRTLYLNNNQIETLPDTIGQLIQIKFIGLSDNLLSSIPNTFGNLKQLRNLFIEHNQLQIEDIPISVRNLQQCVIHI